VLSQVRFGDKVFSPIVNEGEADLLIGFEPLETARYLHYLRDNGAVIYNTRPIGTIGVSIGKEEYPADIQETIKKHSPKVFAFDATEVAVGVGEKRAVNLVLVGASLRFLPIDGKIVENAITNSVPKKLLDINQKAFVAGRSRAT
jgi:indolepyruvate ferredoxin oxidoreductase beta subunit